MPEVVGLKNDIEKSFLKKHNVIGIGVGYKISDGRPTEQRSIIVFVEKKLCPNTITALSSKDIIPPQIDGIPTDVIETGVIRKLNDTKARVRPIAPGYSCGHGEVSAGTIGGFFIDKDGDVVVLSNNHVLANENQAKIGDLIFQPGISDYQHPDLKFRGWSEPLDSLPYFAKLKSFVRLNRNNNIQDSATAVIDQSLIDAEMIRNEYPIIGRSLQGFGNPTVGLSVQKVGRTTGLSSSSIIATDTTFSVEYDFGRAKFSKCCVAGYMSDGGDSGSLILNENMEAVGLLFAGSSRVTIFNPISIIKDHYGLQIWHPSADTSPIERSDSNIMDWKICRQHDSRISISDASGVITIKGDPNFYSFIESSIRFKEITCDLELKGNIGATWGPGIAIVGSRPFKLNVRSEASEYKTCLNIDGHQYPINTVQDKVTLGVKHIFRDVYEISVNEKPIQRIDKVITPTAIRIGKSGPHGEPVNHDPTGDTGEIIIRSVHVK